MDSNQKECRKLQLSWYTPQFLPISSENQWISTISEQLNPYDFMRPDIEEQYWGVPEILTEMRWVLQRAGKIPCEEHNGYDGDFSSSDKMYTKMLAYFRYIGITLGYKAAQYTEAVNYLGPKEYWLFWKKYDYSLRYLRHKVTKCSKDKRRAFFWKWFDTAGEFLDLPGVEKVYEFKSAVAAAKKLRNMSLDHDKIEGFIHSCSVEEFINRMDESFAEYLHLPEVTEAKGRLEHLAKWIEGVLSNFGENTEFLEVNVFDPEHWETIWVGLQKVADCICEQIKGCYANIFIDDSKHISLVTNTGIVINEANDLMEQLRKIANGLECKGRYLKHLIKSYKKCVAVMEYESDIDIQCVIAFSGYFDVPTISFSKKEKVCRLVDDPGSERETLKKFIAVAQDLGCTLLELTDEITEYIMYIDPEEDDPATATKHNLKTDMDSKLLQIGDIKSRYSCCERKLLGYVDQSIVKTGRSPSSLAFYIKMIPCAKCRPVINRWWADHKSVTKIMTDYVYKKGNEDWQPMCPAFVKT